MPSLVSLAVLVLYGYLGNTLTASAIFTGLSLFNQLRFPLLFYPSVCSKLFLQSSHYFQMLATLSDAKVSMNRLNRYLEAPEVESYVQTSGTKEEENDGVVIKIENADFCWSNERDLQSTFINGWPHPLISDVSPPRRKFGHYGSLPTDGCKTRSPRL